MLSGFTLRNLCESHIDNYDSARLQGASYDLTLGSQFISFVEWEHTAPLISTEPDNGNTWYKQRGEWVVINPGAFILGQTREFVRMPSNIAGRVEGKSSLGRRGLMVHVTAGFIDPGFKGVITLEMYNLRKRPIMIRVGDPIAQICFYETTDSTTYTGKYGGPSVELSKYEQNFQG